MTIEKITLLERWKADVTTRKQNKSYLNKERTRNKNKGTTNKWIEEEEKRKWKSRRWFQSAKNYIPSSSQAKENKARPNSDLQSERKMRVSLSSQSVCLFTNQPTPLNIQREQRSFLVELRCCNKLIPTYCIDPSECFILNELEFD